MGLSSRSRLRFLVACTLFVATAAFRLPWLKPAKEADDSRIEAVERALAAAGKSLSQYATKEERLLRRRIVEANLAIIEAHNAKKSSYTMGVNQFIDMTSSELKRYLGVDSAMLRHQAKIHGVKAGADADDTSSSTSSTSSLSSSTSSSDLEKAVAEMADAVLDEAQSAAMLVSLPKHWDWREHGVVTPVKSQGGCGSCWSFSAAEAIESAHAIATGELVVLSEQNILDCTPNPLMCGGKGGCTGATPELAFAAMQVLGGITTEELYPYESANGTDGLPCRFTYDETPVAAELSGYVKLPPNDYAHVMHAVATVGPLSINVDATKFFMYRGGIFDACENTSTSDIDHAVVLVGYGTDEATGQDYWRGNPLESSRICPGLLRNSWSAAWGENGYMRLKRTRDLHCYDDPTPDDGAQCEAVPGPDKALRVCGDCGILFDVLKPSSPEGKRHVAKKKTPSVTDAVAEVVGSLIELAAAEVMASTATN